MTTPNEEKTPNNNKIWGLSELGGGVENKELSELRAEVERLKSEEPFPLDKYYASERENKILRSKLEIAKEALNNILIFEYGGYRKEEIAKECLAKLEEKS